FQGPLRGCASLPQLGKGMRDALRVGAASLLCSSQIFGDDGEQRNCPSGKRRSQGGLRTETAPFPHKCAGCRHAVEHVEKSRWPSVPALWGLGQRGASGGLETW